MGLNYHDYLHEACRLLKYGGWLKIAESASRWGNGKLKIYRASAGQSPLCPDSDQIPQRSEMS
jgi:hypothetical protein